MIRARAIVAVLLVVAAARAQAGVRYELDVRIDSRARTAAGRARITVENRGKLPLAELYLWRYPERLAERSPELNDYNFYWVYPARFNPGAMRTGAVTVDGRAQSVAVVDHPRAGRSTLLRVTLDAPIAPGARAEVAVDFETRVPERYGRFGCFRATCVLDGGFYPMLAGFDDAGAPDLDAPPARAAYRLTVSTPRVSDLVVNGDLRAVPAGGALTVEVPETRDLALVVGPPRLQRREVEHHGVRVILYSASPPPGPEAPGLVLPYLPTDRSGHIFKTVTEALDLLAELGHPVPAGATVRLVEGALRLEVAESLPGFTLVSDQAFAIFPLARFLKFHEFELARAVYAGLVEERAALGERAADLGWAPEVAAGWLVDRYTMRSFRREEWATQILKWYAFIPAIDRIIYAPQVPFASAYFYTLDDPDPLRDSLAQWNNPRPRGRLVYAKLRDVVGDEPMGAIARRQLDGAPLRATAVEISGQPLDWFFAQWLGPYPPVDYRFAEIRSERRGARWHHTAVVEKRGPDVPAPVEPVEVRLRDRSGKVETEKWDGRGVRHAFEFDSAAPISLVELDPRGRLVENLPGANDDLRFDNRRPARWKFVYNNFGGLVTVFPTFGLDLSLDFSLAPILDLKNAFRFVVSHSSSAQIAVTAQYTRGFGRKVTPGSLSQAVSSTLTLIRLDPTFGLQKGVERPGTRLGVGAGWGYGDRLFAWEPRRALSFSVGGSYALTAYDSGQLLSQATVGATFETIRPLADGHGLAFYFDAEATFGDLQSPNQMRTMGGGGGLRGYAVDELLGRAVMFGRAEYRHVFIHSLDWNFLHALFVRGIGGGLFVEGGAMSNCGSYAMRPEGLAADVGYTLRIFGDWLGVSQTTLNIDIAVPLVHGTRTCFGTPNGSPYTTGTRAPIGFFFAFGPPW